MSNQNSLNSMAIILAIVGLIIGAGGGYLIANNSAQAEINSLNEEKNGLTTTISGLENSVATLEDEASDLEDDIQNLENIVAEKETTITQLENDIEENDVTISELETQVATLTNIIEVREGYAQYAIFDFSFEYPNDMITSLGGLMESVATDNSGMIQVSSDDGSTVYTIAWVSSLLEIDAEASLDGGYNELSVFNPERGERESFVHLGHTVYHEEYAIEDVSGDFYMANSAYYCPVSNKLFSINLATYDTEPTPVLLEFIESFLCH